LNVNKIIQTPGGILVRFIGGPLAGKIVRVPELSEELTIHPEDNFGQPKNLAAALRQVHRYLLQGRVTIDGTPVYQYKGCAPR
jgi:hypothetical protein